MHSAVITFRVDVEHDQYQVKTICGGCEPHETLTVVPFGHLGQITGMLIEACIEQGISVIPATVVPFESAAARQQVESTVAEQIRQQREQREASAAGDGSDGEDVEPDQ